MADAHPQWKAGGDIRVCRFVNLHTDESLLEADANEWTVGISSEAAQDAPIPGASALAAASGDYVVIHGDGEVCRLVLGSGGATVMDLLKSDADGGGVTIAASGTTQQLYGAEALETGLEGELIRVRIIRGKTYPALA